MQGHVFDYSRASAGRDFAWLQWPVAAMILMIVGAFILPMFNRASICTDDSACAAHMKMIGLAAIMYANANSGHFPDDLSAFLSTEDLPPSVFNCPSTSDTPARGQNVQEYVAEFKKPGHLSYVYIGKGLTTTTATADVVVLYEPLSNHGTGMNVAFGDGHVEWLTAAKAKSLLKQVAAGVRPVTLKPHR